MAENVYDTLSTILVDDFGVPEDELTPDATFEALGLDSLDLVEITLVIDEQLGIRIPDEELQNITTPADAVSVIERLRAVSV